MIEGLQQSLKTRPVSGHLQRPSFCMINGWFIDDCWTSMQLHNEASFWGTDTKPDDVCRNLLRLQTELEASQCSAVLKQFSLSRSLRTLWDVLRDPSSQFDVECTTWCVTAGSLTTSGDPKCSHYSKQPASPWGAAWFNQQGETPSRGNQRTSPWKPGGGGGRRSTCCQLEGGRKGCMCVRILPITMATVLHFHHWSRHL